MKLKRLWDYKADPTIYSIEEAVEVYVGDTNGGQFGQIESLESAVERLTELVAKLIAVSPIRPDEVLTSFEVASEAEIKAYEER